MENCPYCNKPITPNLQQCPHCGAPIRATVTPSEKSSKSHFCPNCSSPVDKADIICIYCGTNLLTGTKLEANRPIPKRYFLPTQWKKYLLLGGIVIALLLILTGSIIYFSYDPVKIAINLSKTDILGAIDTLQNYIQRNPKNIRARLILGKLYLKNTQYDEALEQFEKVAELDNRSLESAWLSLHTAYIKDPNNIQLQTKYLKKLAELLPNRDDISLLINLGDKKMARLEKNEKLFENINKLKLSIDSVVSGYILAGLQKDAEKLVRNKESSISPIISSLIISANQGKEREIEFINNLDLSSLNLSPNEWGYLTTKFLSTGETTKSLQCAQRMKSASSTLSPTLHYLYTLTLLNSNLTTDAIIELDRIRNSESPYSTEATLDLAEIYLSQENISKSEELIQSVRNKGNQSARSYLIEGRIALLNNDLAKAQQCFSTAIQRDPNYAPAYLENGLVYIRRGILREGLNNLKSYIRIVKNTFPKYSVAEIEVLIEQIEQTVINVDSVQQSQIQEKT
ncbi:MAG: zinc ribbon domain-containing protein [Candidatus Hydrogenedentes bacterium]|nr:zinc ribbon domain-containing protein [Candidatus Hydrogenedentota bacterium]